MNAARIGGGGGMDNMADTLFCNCAACRTRDRRQPREGRQMMLLAVPPEPKPLAPEVVVDALRRSRFRVSTEDALQLSIAAALTEHGVIFEREARLGPGERIDFLAEGGLGIEAKARYGRRDIYRQLTRYAQREQIRALILVTGTAMGMPATINGKPVFVVSCGRAAL